MNHLRLRNTELDGLVKFWSEIFESLFADNRYNITCKWGESQAYHSEYKTDIRVIAVKGASEVDLIDVEAVRNLSNKMTNKDQYKDWISSTFFPPVEASNPLILPVPLYDSSNKKQRTAL
ncbi:hypothetical protein PS15m_011522 [Mucor circinelloides]